MPPHDAVAYTATGSRTAVSSALHAAASVRSAASCAVSVPTMRRPALLALSMLAVERAQIARRDEVDTGLGASAQHHAAVADVAFRAIEAARNVDARRDVRPAVLAVLEMNRQLGEIGLRTGPHHL